MGLVLNAGEIMTYQCTVPVFAVWYEFPEDSDSFGVEGQHLVGDALLVHPVSKSGSQAEAVYFPGDGNQRWFDIHTNEEVNARGTVNVNVIYDHIPGKC